MAFVIYLPPRNDRQAVEQRLGFPPAVGFDDADDDVHPIAPLGLGRKQHLIGLADPGCGTEKDLEASATLLFCRIEQGFG